MSAGQSGFTLLEVVVVLAVLGLLAGIVASRGPLRSERLELDASSRNLSNALSLARSRAIVTGRSVAVTTSAAGFNLEGRAFSRLPRGQTMSSARIVFTPEGQSSGGTIELVARHERMPVSVNWLTGLPRRGAYQTLPAD